MWSWADGAKGYFAHLFGKVLCLVVDSLGRTVLLDVLALLVRTRSRDDQAPED